MSKPTIDEQIKHQRKVCDFRKENVSILNATVPDVQESILASLERLKAIDAVQVPEEPEWAKDIRNKYALFIHESWMPAVLRHYDTLRDLLKQCKHNSSVTMDELGEMRDRAEAAEAKLARIEKMGREPSKGMLSVPPHFKYVRAFTAMFNKMMEELK